MDRKTRNILILLCLSLVFFLTAAPVMIIRGPVVVPSSGGSYVLSESWNGATEDNTWTTPPTGWDDDNTTNPIEGAQDLKAGSDPNSTGYMCTTLSSSSDNFYVIVKYKSVDDGGGFIHIPNIIIKDSSDNILARAAVHYNDTNEAYRLYLYYNSGSSNVYDSSFNYNRTGVCVLKVWYEKGTGSNAVAGAKLTDISDYNTNGWNGSPESVTISNGTDTTQAAKFCFYKGGTSVIVQYDEIRGNDTDTVDY